jgi:hypothetical protein
MQKQSLTWGMLVLGVVLGGSCVASFLELSSRPALQQGAAAAEATEDDLNVRYAQACLKLAQWDWESAEAENKRIPGVIPPAVLQPLRQIVAIAEAELSEAKRGGPVSLREVRVRSAEASLQAAETNLSMATGRTPRAEADTNVERLRLAVEVARLDLARARSAKDEPSLADLQWQLYDLRKELLKLRSKVASLAAR